MAVTRRVVVGFAEALAAIESAWCLADAGYDVVAFARAGRRRPPLASSRRIQVVPVPPPEADAAATVAAVAALAAEDPSAILLPLDDGAVWVCDRLATGSGTAARVAGPTGPRARLALDKREQLQAAEKAGFAVPATTLAGDPPVGPGPWMVKPALATVEADGRLRRPSGRVATRPREVDLVAGGIGSPVLVQPLVAGTGEGIFGFAAGGGIHALSAHRRVRMMNPRGSGSSACRSIDVDPDLVEPTRRLLADAGWHGIFMVELLRDRAGCPWFMELNGRAWGSMALAVRRGLPYPEWAVQGAQDPGWRPEPVPDPPHLTCRHLGRELVHLLAVLRGAPPDAPAQWPARLATVRAMLRPARGTRWYHARRGESAVLVRDTWIAVGEQVRRRRG